MLNTDNLNENKKEGKTWINEFCFFRSQIIMKNLSIKVFSVISSKVE